MAGGWAKDGAVQDQIDASVADGVERARASLKGGTARTECAECGESIPEARRRALPGVRLCVRCQSRHDEDRSAGGINRRGSKDNQLR
ncbi:MAG: DksA/TraR family C4-type zinc finger protein [Candidatus Wenzhouxiangella sp. M2_3B_020]